MLNKPMSTLREIILRAEEKRIAVGHFNISDIAALNAIAAAAKELSVPVIIGVSEGERDFIGVKNAVALIRSMREDGYPIFLNADHAYSVEKAKEAIDAGYDAVIFDGAKLSLEENIAKTKEVVEYAKSRKSRNPANPVTLVEGELGYIGTSSKILNELPNGAALQEKDMTTSEDAARFVKETEVDLLAPAIGNIHGMMKDAPNPNLNIKRISEIKKSADVPLVLHGGSGISDADFKAAVAAGISIIHINTEIRLAWRRGLEQAFEENPEEITPYKLLPAAEKEIKKIVSQRLKLFNGML